MWGIGSTSATPRSEIFRVPSVVSNRLLGFMSLCIIPWLCKYSNPCINWQKYLDNKTLFWLTSCSTTAKISWQLCYPWACHIGNFFRGVLSINSCNPDTQYSKIRYIFCFSSLCITSYKRITFLWFSCCSNLISLIQFINVSNNFKHAITMENSTMLPLNILLSIRDSS